MFLVCSLTKRSFKGFLLNFLKAGQLRPPRLVTPPPAHWFPRQNTPNWKFPQNFPNLPSSPDLNVPFNFRFKSSFFQFWFESDFEMSMLMFLLSFDFKVPLTFWFSSSFKTLVLKFRPFLYFVNVKVNLNFRL